MKRDARGTAPCVSTPVPGVETPQVGRRSADQPPVARKRTNCRNALGTTNHGVGGRKGPSARATLGRLRGPLFDAPSEARRENIPRSDRERAGAFEDFFQRFLR
ncbi:hypothetical protein [Halorussus caseinilyticus]|uniref:Uncharacterized protein n=1 Tax=Halorussus caseinilyticus TaxID=3034025 RepID=A0ABD5WKX3_9EURY